MGLIDDGVAVMVTLNLDDKIYDAIYWYDNMDRSVLTIERNMQDILGVDIEEHEDYDTIMEELGKKVSPIDDELKGKLDVIV